jgi:hypothetical protein
VANTKKSKKVKSSDEKKEAKKIAKELFKNLKTKKTK